MDDRDVPNLLVRKSDVSSISAAMDHIANITPAKRSAVVNIGNDSITEKAKSGKFVAIDEKSENARENI